MARKRLKERRAVVVRIYTILGLVVLFLLGGLLIYGAWRPEVRVQEVGISGANTLAPQKVGEYVKTQIEGRRYALLPKDSIFVLPIHDLEEGLLSAFPLVERAEVERTSFSSVEVHVEERIPRILWCGASTSTPCVTGDTKGVLFPGSGDGLLYVEGPLLEEGYVYGNVVFAPGAVMRALSLVDAITERGVLVHKVMFIRPDEVALTLGSGVELYYVLGEEDVIAETLPPILQSEDLSQLEYIDMRFGKRVYIQRRD